MIRIDVTARQVLHLGVRPDAGWLTDTHRFVPGSVLRGALAATWLAEHRGPGADTTADAEFHRLFEGAARFGPLYIGDDALRPLSVHGCKYPAAQACAVFAHDAAFDGPAPASCPNCDGPVIASKGEIDAPQLVGHTRVELDERERARDGQLFTRRALPAGTTFTGLMAGDLDGDFAWLAGQEWHIRLGGRRSTAGLAVLRASMDTPQPAAFDGLSTGGRRLVLRLLAPGIFVDGHGRPTWLPDVAELGDVLGTPVRVEAAFARPTLVSGWHARANLPKSQDFAVAAGSVFVLAFDGATPDAAALDRLWRAGIGLRRAEGNGWISLRRWRPRPHVTAGAPPVARRDVDDLVRQLCAAGVAALVMDDLRRHAQDRFVAARLAARVDAVLDKRRYANLTPAARALFRRALDLSPADAAEVAARLSAFDRTSTRRRGDRA